MDRPRYVLEFEKPIHELQEQLIRLRELSTEQNVDVGDEISAIERKIEHTRKEIQANLTPWQKVQLARHPDRPYALDYIRALFEDFQELHGDRAFRDDQALIGGPAFFESRPVMVVAQQKGRNTKDNLRRNFGCPNPEGYRKALRLMEMAERFRMPIISLIDTPGAYPGVGAEERHVAEAIAVNIREMSRLRVPSIAVVIGEGGSGGALGIAVTDRVLIMQNAYYSVISPEGCAAILWKDRKHAPRAAEALKITADKLLELKIVDDIVSEPLGGAHVDPRSAIENLRLNLSHQMRVLTDMREDERLEQRYQKYRRIGHFTENAAVQPQAARSHATAN